jgi:sugar lactone lactonase YvrE
LLLAGCGGGGGDNPVTTAPLPAPTPAPAPVTGAASLAASQVLAGGAPVSLRATASDGSTPRWTLADGSPGRITVASGADAAYQPPAAVSVPTVVTLTATWTGGSKTLRLTVYPDPGAPRLELIAGSLGSLAMLDGSGTAARFANIRDIAVDASGNAFVADALRFARNEVERGRPTALRRVTPDGTVKTLARLPYGHADGSAALAQLGEARSVAAAPDGSLFVLAYDGDLRVRVLRPDGSVDTVLDAAHTDKDSLRLITDPSGTLYIMARRAVWRVVGNATQLVAGDPTALDHVDGVGSAAHFKNLKDAVWGGNGTLYLLDGYTVRALVVATSSVSTLAGQASPSWPDQFPLDGTRTTARIGDATSIAISAQQIYVLDPKGVAPDIRRLIRRIDMDGTVTTVGSVADPVYSTDAPVPGSTSAHTLLRGSAGGALLLASQGEILRGTPTGGFAPLAGFEGNSMAQVNGAGPQARFLRPQALAAGKDGSVYVLETPGQLVPWQSLELLGLHVRKIAPDGTVSTVIDRDTEFDVANGMAVASNGDIYVANAVPMTIRGYQRGGAIHRIAPDGTLSVVAGVPGAGTDDQRDGTGAAARFTRPRIEGIDADDNIYVTDTQLGTTVRTFRKVTPAGVVTTIPALPAGLRAAPDGNTYSVDTERQIVLRTTPGGAQSIVAGEDGVFGPRLGPLPGLLYQPRDVVPTGPGSFAVIAGGAVLRLVVPH